MDIIKTKQLTELKDYIDSLSDKYHAKYTNQVRGIMYNIKRKGNLTNEELGLILGIPEAKVDGMLHETWDGHVSTKLVTKLQLLSCGVFGLPGCQMRKAEIDTIDSHFDKILCPVTDETEQVKEEPDLDIFDMLLGIFDGDSEFQETMRKKYGEYKERGAQILREVEEKYRSAKKTAETAQKVAKTSKDLNEAAKSVINKIVSSVGDMSKSDQKREPKNEKKSEETESNYKVECFAYYKDKDGNVRPISLYGLAKEIKELFSNLAD